jgi:hypothetical protein
VLAHDLPARHAPLLLGPPSALMRSTAQHSTARHGTAQQITTVLCCAVLCCGCAQTLRSAVALLPRRVRSSAPNALPAPTPVSATTAHRHSGRLAGKHARLLQKLSAQETRVLQEVSVRSVSVH